ncbi:sulfotransferase family protein [Microbulbifer mangrovi]|uniref:sulfotransferase family protein n=1 Tax=Microbulbifer mangrovi TaxID=927787 RepID=UPI00099042BA|nr:sulfotransferase [Microbulbifer mangrovi]
MFFLIGAPRSGTKLLRECLNANGGIFIPPAETEFYISFKKNFTKVSTRNLKDQVDFLYRFVCQTPYATFLKLESNHRVCRDSWVRYLTEDWIGDVNVQAHFEALLYASQFDPSQKVLLGDKSPSYMQVVDVLLSDFEDAKFIFICRDPRDVVLSSSRAWGKSKIRTAKKWAALNAGLPALISKCNSNIHLVKYENLISNPDKTVESVVQFLGVPYDDAWHKRLGITENLGGAKGRRGIFKPEQYFHHPKNYIIDGLTADVASQLRYHIDSNFSQRIISKLFYSVLSFPLAFFDIFRMFYFDVRKMGLWSGVKFRVSYYLNSGKVGGG